MCTMIICLANAYDDAYYDAVKRGIATTTNWIHTATIFSQIKHVFDYNREDYPIQVLDGF